MKKVIAIVVAILLVFSLSVFAKAKTKEQKKFAKAVRGENVDWAEADSLITTNVGGLLFAALNAHYEMVMSEGTGLGFNGSLGWWGFGGWSTLSLGAGAEFNWYFQKHAPNGWFAGPGAGIIFYNTTYNDDVLDETVSSGALGFQINGHGGYRWIWDGGFALDVGLGLYYTILNLTVDVAGEKQTLPIGGFGPGIGVNLGYAW